jgi:IclR family pca regulon transcriptional regulator
MSLSLNVGGRLPAYSSSIGQVLLAYGSQADLDAYLARVKLIRFTENTLASREMLIEFLKTVRQTGYAIANQHRESRLCTMAVPVRNAAGAVVAGINVIVQGGRVSISQMPRRFLARLQTAADELGRLLGAS